MLELVTLPPAFGMRNVSPFCLKAEMLLKSLDLSFTISQISDPRKAPKGKLPYLVADGQTIPDSELITEYLDATTQGRVYAGLSDAQKAQGVALTRLAEDHLYHPLGNNIALTQFSGSEPREVRTGRAPFGMAVCHHR